ncbi:putative inactive 1-aminocyclopropane-1-carboxylate synthase-like protein 2 [Manis javanica]|nr:putative inactive 1-aminocyclopropane-1-carboxylate synthase-like protein 2 [Manis javanica]
MASPTCERCLAGSTSSLQLSLHQLKLAMDWFYHVLAEQKQDLIVKQLGDANREEVVCLPTSCSSQSCPESP